ncbi:CGL1 [Auxenochlorella protothecoides x Auxenochlorella symbiontica]
MMATQGLTSRCQTLIQASACRVTLSHGALHARGPHRDGWLFRSGVQFDSTHATRASSGRKRRLGLVHASNGESPEAPSTSLSPDEAYMVLGLATGATFEEVVRSKNRLLAKHAPGSAGAMRVEGAYDSLFMHLMRTRLAGDTAVPNKVKYADVRPRPKPKSKERSKPQQLPGGFATVSTLSDTQTASVVGVFVALGAWSLLQGLTEPNALAAANSIPGLQLALGTGSAIYILRDRKKVGLGRAVAITGAGLLLGTLVGGAVQSWLHVEMLPLWGFRSPGVLVGEFSLAGICAAVALLA